jgi:hypothetical protein
MADSDQKARLHAKLDERYAAPLQQLQDSLKELNAEIAKGHEWIDSAPDAVLRLMEASSEEKTVAVQMKIPTATVTPTNGNGHGSEADRVLLREPIEKIIRGLPVDTDITSADIHRQLLVNIPRLKDENQVKLKARVAVTLGHLVEKKLIHITQRGGGNVPHVYQRTYKPVTNISSGVRK